MPVYRLYYIPLNSSSTGEEATGHKSLGHIPFLLPSQMLLYVLSAWEDSYLDVIDNFVVDNMPGCLSASLNLVYYPEGRRDFPARDYVYNIAKSS